MRARENVEERACTYASKEDYDVDLAEKERGAEFERGAVGLERKLAQRRSDDGTATVPGDDRRYFGCAPALQRQHAKVLKVCRRFHTEVMRHARRHPMCVRLPAAPPAR